MVTTPTTAAVDAAALDELTVLDAADVSALPWSPVPGRPGVSVKVLWRFRDYVQALLRYEPGASTPGEPHLAAHHHIWVVSGRGSVAGRKLGAGSYVHVPPGAAHPVTDVGADGLLLLRMHRPHAPEEADRRR